MGTPPYLVYVRKSVAFGSPSYRRERHFEFNGERHPQFSHGACSAVEVRRARVEVWRRMGDNAFSIYARDCVGRLGVQIQPSQCLMRSITADGSSKTPLEISCDF